MLISIGRRTGHSDLTGSVLECHKRIRHFAALAVRLATEDASETDRANTGSSIARYFGEALPLHVSDEEESLLPRLRGRTPELDRALETMRGEHGEHRAPLAELVALAQRIARDGATHAEHASRLGELGRALASDFGAHLEQEERVIVPAIAAYLGVEEQRAVMLEMRARRGSAVRVTPLTSDPSF